MNTENQSKKPAPTEDASPDQIRRVPKKKQLPDPLKAQLQDKSRTRRKRNAAETGIDAAGSRHGRNDIQPDLTIVEKPIDALHPSPSRARVTEPEQLERVICSIQQFGLVQPILTTGDGCIVSGHVVWEAAQHLGCDTIRCLAIDHLDEAEIKALSLALNRMAETGSWDLDRLRDQLIEIETAGIELQSTGFTLPEIDQIIISDDPEADNGNAEGEEEIEQDHVLVAKLGDLFRLGENRLLCGDALDAASYARLLEGSLAQSVFSDPPYNCPIEGFVSGLGQHKHADFAMAVGEMDDASFSDFLTSYLEHCRANTSDGAVVFACMDWRQIDRLLIAAAEVGLKRTNIAVWNKGAGGMGGLYRSAHEMIGVFCNGKSPATNNVELGRHGRDRTNVWSYPGANQRGSSSGKALADHPTPKPVELVADALLDVTQRGDTVLDPFMGSGTTMIAAEKTGRKCCGIELDPLYVDRAIRRWEQYSGDQATHIESGMTLAELRDRRSEPTEAAHD